MGTLVISLFVVVYVSSLVLRVLKTIKWCAYVVCEVKVFQTWCLCSLYVRWSAVICSADQVSLKKEKKEKVGINAPVCRWQWFWHGFFKDNLAFDKVRYFLYRRYKYRWNSIIFFNDYSEYLLGYLINCFLKFIQCMFNDVCHSVLYWFCIVTICQKIFVWFLLACLASINIYFFMCPCQYCAS